MAMLRTTNLTRRYGARIGVDSVNLQVEAGQVFGFLGPNGAGKTTTIRLLMGFLKPHGGQAEIAGLDCWTHSAQVKRDVGYLPGDLRLYPWLTLRSGTSIVSQVRGEDISARANELAERFELEPTLPVRKMSRGTRQKLGLVLAMAHRPKLLVLDEPTSGLDPLMQSRLADLVREAAAAGSAVFFSSHTLSEVDSLCDRVAIVRHGRVIVDKSLAQLRHEAPRMIELQYADEPTAAAVVLPEMLRLVERRGDVVRCELEGTTPPLVAWASQQPLVDIRIGRPDLETVFHRLYHETDEGV